MSVLNVVDFGAKGDGAFKNNTAIQAAINAAQAGDTVHVPAGTFMVDGILNPSAPGALWLKSNITFELASGAVLQCIPNSATTYILLQLDGCINTKVIGPGTIMGDRDKHGNQNVQGWWGFGISIANSSDITVQNLTVAKCWGDGISIEGCSRVLIDHVVTDSNRRQNMSLISGDNITFTNNTVKNAAMSGLDLESDLVSQTISNVLIKNNLFTGSGGPAHIGVGSATGTYKNIKITANQFDLKMQPIFAHDNAGKTNIPWWAYLLKVMLYEGLHDPSYRFWGYPTEWSRP